MNGTVHVTVTGILTSATSVTVTNQATVSAFELGETTSTNNSSSVQVGIVSGQVMSSTIYLPIVIKSTKTTVLAYNENFDSGEPWIEFNVNGCNARNQNGQYWIELDSTDRTCLPPAQNENKPESPYRTYGEFQVDVYHSEGESEAWYGLFINGAGGSDYYLFRVQPNEGNCSSGGDWELIRRKDNNQTLLASGACHPSIKRGYDNTSANTLKISHENDRNLSVFVNGTLLGVVQEDTVNHLTDTGTGLFSESRNVKVIMKFDNFKVFKFD